MSTIACCALQVGATVAEACLEAMTSAGLVSNAAAAMALCCKEELQAREGDLKPFGLPLKTGREVIASEHWAAIKAFIESKAWWHDQPACEDDLKDPLTKDRVSYGAFPLGFDFHMTPAGPKLVEINTNAGGLPTAYELSASGKCEKAMLQTAAYQALVNEFQAVRGSEAKLTAVAIVDTAAPEQPLFKEMQLYGAMLRLQGVECFVVSPEELVPDEQGHLTVAGRRIDLVYNRLTDFRLEQPEHAHLRRATVDDKVVLTPHPATYARVADKRLLLRLSDAGHGVVPATTTLGARPMEEWVRERKQWVFKPASGAGSQGVYRGDKISVAKLRSLPEDTICQEYCPPGVSEDGSKFDFRVYTHGPKVLGLVSRHFTGQVMEMRSQKAGLKAALPNDACCISAVVNV